MADKVVSVDINGSAAGIISAMAQAENAVQTQTRVISGHFSELSSSVNKVIGIIGTMSAVLAGGAMFKSFITESQQWTGDTMKLAKVLGITTEEAGAYKVAMHSLGVEQDVLEGVSMKLSSALVKKQQTFKDLGIEIKDVSTGKLLPMGTIIENTVEHLNGLEAGSNRNAAGAALFGRSWKEMQPILKLTSEKVAEGRKELQDLGLEVGPDRVKQFLQYRTEVKYLGLVSEALKVQVGNALMPALIGLGQWFKDVAPAALFVFGGALKGVMAFIEYATLGVTTLWETWKALWGQFSVTSIALVQVITKIISGDFSGAWQTAKQGIADFGQFGVKWVDNIALAADKTNARVSKIFGITAAAKSAPGPAAAGQFDIDKADKDTHGRQMSQEDAQLKAILAGFKMREQAVKEGTKSLIDDEDFYYQTGMVGQAEFNSKKYDLERQSLLKTQSIIDQEIDAISASNAKKLAIAQTPEEKGKVEAEAKKETTDKLAERQKLNSELYQLDSKYFTDTTVLAQKKAADEKNSLAIWAQTRRLAQDAELQKTDEFYGMVDAAAGSSYINDLARIGQEEQAWISSWAEMADGFEEQERRRLAIAQMTEQKITLAIRQEQERKLDITAKGFSSAASIADSFYQLSGKKSKAAFKAYQITESGAIVASTASAAMQSYKAMSGIPVVGPALGAAAAIAAGLAGAVQLKNLWSASGDSANTSVGGSSGSSGGYSGQSPVVTQPSAGAQTQQQGNVTVQIMGNVIGEDRWVEENLIPSLNSALGRNVTLNFGH